MKEKTIKLDPSLTPDQRQAVRQTVANLALEEMYPSEECIRELQLVASGKKSMGQRIRELNERYKKK